MEDLLTLLHDGSIEQIYLVELQNTILGNIPILTPEEDVKTGEKYLVVYVYEDFEDVETQKKCTDIDPNWFYPSTLADLYSEIRELNGLKQVGRPNMFAFITIKFIRMFSSDYPLGQLMRV